MFSMNIINSARFLKMPIDAQCLYFHLGIRADDDGIVEAFNVIRLIGSNEDNLKVLEAKEFIRILNEDLVTFIVDWKEHNLIRADRKKESVYIKLLKDDSLKRNVDGSAGNCLTSDGQVTDKCPHRIGEVRLGKERLGKDNISKQSLRKNDLNYLIDLFKNINPTYKELFKNKTQRKALQYLVDNFTFEKIEKILKVLPEMMNDQYCPIVTTPLELKNKFAQLVAHARKRNNTISSINNKYKVEFK